MKGMLLWGFRFSLVSLYSQNKQLWRNGKALEGVRLSVTDWTMFPLEQQQMLTNISAHSLSTAHFLIRKAGTPGAGRAWGLAHPHCQSRMNVRFPDTHWKLKPHVLLWNNESDGLMRAFPPTLTVLPSWAVEALLAEGC